MKGQDIGLLHQKRYKLSGYVLTALYLAILALPSTVSAQSHTLTIVSQASGLVSSSATVPALLNTANIACGTDNRYGSGLTAASTRRTRCEHTYAQGTTVTLIARPNHPNQFIGWAGNCSGTNSELTLTMDSAKTCQAVFGKPNGYVQLGVSRGQSHYRPDYACAVTDLSFIHCWGSGAGGQLGDGMSENRDTPTTVSGITNAIAASAGGLHTCTVLRNGALYCWGTNDEGQLGDGTQTNRPLPTTITGINNAINVSAGEEHTCALLANGAVRCWGDDSSGQIGDSMASDNRLTPTAVPNITNAVVVAAGNSRTCAVLDNGAVQCWGFIGSNDDNSVFHHTPTTVSGITNAITVAVGADSACAVLADGAMRCWGNQRVGQLGNGVKRDSSTVLGIATVMDISTAVMVSAGNTHACAVLRDGQAQCWGGASDGNNGNRGNSPIAQSRLGMGSRGGSTTPVDVADIQSVASVAAGRHTSCALLRNGLAYCWGSDADGAIGNSTATAAAGYVNPQLVADQSLTPASLQRLAVRGFGFTEQIKLANPASTWSISPSLPAGLRFDTVTGAIYGIPSAASVASYTITGTGTGTGSTIALTLTVAALTDFSIRQTGEDLRITENSPLGTEVNGFNLQLLYRSNPIAVNDIRWSLVSENPPDAANPFLVAPDGTLYVGGNTDSRALDYERLSETDRQYTLSARAEFAGVVGFPIRSDSNIRISVTNVLENIVVENALRNAIPRIRHNAEVNEPVGGISLVGREDFPGTPPLTGLTWTLNPASAFTISSRTGTVRVANSLSSLSVGSSATVVVSASKDGVTSNNLSLTIGITPSAELLKLHIKLFLEGPLQ